MEAAVVQAGLATAVERERRTKRLATRWNSFWQVGRTGVGGRCGVVQHLQCGICGNEGTVKDCVACVRVCRQCDCTGHTVCHYCNNCCMRFNGWDADDDYLSDGDRPRQVLNTAVHERHASRPLVSIWEEQLDK